MRLRSDSLSRIPANFLDQRLNGPSRASGRLSALGAAGYPPLYPPMIGRISPVM